MGALNAAARYMDSEYDRMTPREQKKLRKQAAKPKVELPAPLVKPHKHPFTFIKQKVMLIGTAALLTYVGVLIVAAIYYLLFEVWAPATNFWHELVPNSDQRHNIRNVAEGLFGGLLGQVFIWNHYKKSIYKKRNILDKIEIALRIPNVKDDRKLSGWALAITPFFVLLYAVPGFLIAEAIVNAINPVVAAVPTTTDFWGHMKGVVTDSYPQKLIGLGAAFVFGRRPAKGVFDDLQVWFAERRVAQGKECSWYHLPVFKARVNDVAKKATWIPIAKHEGFATYALRAAVPIGVLLAVFGFIAINYNTILK